MIAEQIIVMQVVGEVLKATGDIGCYLGGLLGARTEEKLLEALVPWPSSAGRTASRSEAGTTPSPRVAE